MSWARREASQTEKTPRPAGRFGPVKAPYYTAQSGVKSIVDFGRKRSNERLALIIHDFTRNCNPFCCDSCKPRPAEKKCNKSAKGRIWWLDFSEKPATLGTSNRFFCVTCANFVSKYAIFAASVAKRPALCYALPVELGGYAARGQTTTPSQNPPLLPLPKAHAVRYALQLFYAHKTAIFPCKTSSSQHFLHR